MEEEVEDEVEDEVEGREVTALKPGYSLLVDKC